MFARGVFILSMFSGVTTGLNRTCDPPEESFTDPELGCSSRDACPSDNIGIASIVQSDWVTFQERNCFCDDECGNYGDCCANKGRVKRERIVAEGTFQCHIIQGIFSSGLPIYVVDRCPDQWADDVIKDYCEKEANARNGLILNWFVSDDNLILYRNLYCAWCHEKTNVTYWRARIACDRVVELEGDLQTPDYAHNLLDIIEEGHCRVKYDTPDDVERKRFVRMCKPLIDICAPDWLDTCVRNLCEGGESTSAYVYSNQNRKTYKNKYCAKCNYANDVTCEDTVSSTLYMPVFGVSVDTTFYPLNIIFDLNPGDGPLAEYKIGEKSGDLLNDTVTELRACPRQHVYDPFIGHCRFVVCRSGFVYDRRGCVQDDTAVGNGTIDDCLLIELNKTEFTLLHNGSLFANSSGLIYNLTEYEITGNGSALVCTNMTRNYTDLVYEGRYETIIKFSAAQGIVSIIGQTISIVALTLHIIIYSILPKLRNLAGQCVLCLASALLVSQFLFLVGVSTSTIDPVDQYGACATVAVVTHGAFLCTFTWMNVMAYDVCRTFSGSVHKSSAEGLRKRFYKYCAYAWGVPVLVVTAGVITNHVSLTSSIRPAYGEWLCWFNNRKALFVFFALPVGLIIATNTVLFIVTAVRIYKVQEMAKMVTQNNENHRYGLYLKLFVIMGLTWIFAFVATATDSEVLWYLFLICNTLQGAFLCIAFIFTRQVLGMLKEKRSKLSYFCGPHSHTEDRTLSTTVSNRKTSSVHTYVVTHKV